MVTVNLASISCHWCGGPNAFLCTCGYRSCENCKLFPIDDKCVHRKYEPVESDGWDIDGLGQTITTNIR